MKFKRVLVYVAFAALCLLLSTRWMFADAWPDTLSTLSSQAMAAGIAAVALLVYAALQTEEGGARKVWPTSAAFGGLMLFTTLNAGLLAGFASPKHNDLLIALALAPVVISLVLNARGGNTGIAVSDVAPGILAAAGLLLILPQPSFDSWKIDLALVGLPVLGGLGAVLVAPQTPVRMPLHRGAMASVGATVLFTTYLIKPPRLHPTLVATALDLLVLLLALVSILGLGARRFGAQFAAVPLLFLLQGLVFERVRPNWEQAGGLAMVLIATVWLLRSQRATKRDDNARLLA